MSQKMCLNICRILFFVPSQSQYGFLVYQDLCVSWWIIKQNGQRSSKMKQQLSDSSEQKKNHSNHLQV